MKLAWYCLQYPDGDLVGLDQSSGGYPIRAKNPADVKYWLKSKDAVDYARIMWRENFRLVIVELHIR